SPPSSPGATCRSAPARATTSPSTARSASTTGCTASPPAYRDVRELTTSIKELNNGGSEVIWTSYAYDAMKQLVQVREARGNLTRLSYDNLGRRTIVENPDAGATETVYDLASNVTARITARLKAQNARIAYDYDALGRLTTISYPTFPGNNVTYS